MTPIFGIELKEATESFDYWKGTKLAYFGNICMLSMEWGESSFNPRAEGDKVHGVTTAWGIYQDHQDRCDEIEKGCGVNVKTGTHIEQLQGADYEITKGWYRRVRPLLNAAKSIEEAIIIGVKDFEQSGNQARDVVRRLGFANYVSTIFPKY